MGDKLGLNWAKLSSNCYWASLQLNSINSDEQVILLAKLTGTNYSKLSTTFSLDLSTGTELGKISGPKSHCILLAR